MRGSGSEHTENKRLRVVLFGGPYLNLCLPHPTLPRSSSECGPLWRLGIGFPPSLESHHISVRNEVQ